AWLARAAKACGKYAREKDYNRGLEKVKSPGISSGVFLLLTFFAGVVRFNIEFDLFNCFCLR
ncbi:MAG: hypothetical protein V1860_02645, partial [bacterium]